MIYKHVLIESEKILMLNEIISPYLQSIKDRILHQLIYRKFSIYLYLQK